MYKFSENSIVCFFGDSITHKGSWIRRVYDYYRNVAGIKFEMYNCGVAGANATAAFGTMEENLLIYNPTDVVIMFGMNDVWRDLYSTAEVTSDVIMQRRMRIDNCISSINSIADKLAAKGIRLIFCTPTPHDELTDDDASYPIGVAAALREVSERVKVISQKFGANVVDFNTKMYNSLKTVYKTGQTFINPDRVHPSPLGNELMAQVFLAAQGFDVEITPDIGILANLAEKPYSDWENVRYELETAAKANDFFEWCIGATIKDKEKIRQMAKNMLPNEKNPFVIDCINSYLDPDTDIKKALEKLIAHTKSVYDV